MTIRRRHRTRRKERDRSPEERTVGRRKDQAIRAKGNLTNLTTKDHVEDAVAEEAVEDAEVEEVIVEDAVARTTDEPTKLVVSFAREKAIERRIAMITNSGFRRINE